MIHIISDVHGCYDTLLKLMEKLPKDSIKIFVGDLIDRGPKSKEVVQYIIDNKFLCIKGNHEQMFIEELFKVNLTGWGEETYWQKYIALETLTSYNYNFNDLTEHLNWFKTLPVFIEFNEIKNNNGKHLVVSHSSISNKLNEYKIIKEKILNNDKNIKILEEDLEEIEEFISWNKNLNEINGENNNYFNIFGHISIPFTNLREHKKYLVNDNILINNEKNFACIDSGCVYGEYLTAIEFPSLKIFQEKKIDLI